MSTLGPWSLRRVAPPLCIPCAYVVGVGVMECLFGWDVALTRLAHATRSCPADIQSLPAPSPERPGQDLFAAPSCTSANAATHPHIPAFLPALPEPHTYSSTKVGTMFCTVCSHVFLCDAMRCAWRCCWSAPLEAVA